MEDELNVQLYRQLAWDYHFSAEDIADLISGRKEIIGHYRRQDIFRKILESYSWFTVLQLFTPGQIQGMLTEELIESLRMPSLRKKYAFIRKRLQETLPVTG
jgi:hypothetical protein